MKKPTPRQIIMTMGVVLYVVAGLLFWDSTRYVTWKQVTGTTISSTGVQYFRDSGWRADHTVHYKVGKQDYYTQTTDNDTGTGQPVFLRYNPKNPAQTARPSSTDRALAIIALIPATLCLVGGYFAKDS